jgi:hypothetical protein
MLVLVEADAGRETGVGYAGLVASAISADVALWDLKASGCRLCGEAQL